MYKIVLSHFSKDESDLETTKFGNYIKVGPISIVSIRYLKDESHFKALSLH